MNQNFNLFFTEFEKIKRIFGLNQVLTIKTVKLWHLSYQIYHTLLTRWNRT